MCVWGEGEGEGKVVEQQIGALGNPCSPFSSSSSLLCIRRGFDKNPILGSAIQGQSHEMNLLLMTCMVRVLDLNSVEDGAIFLIF